MTARGSAVLSYLLLSATALLAVAGIVLAVSRQAAGYFAVEAAIGLVSSLLGWFVTRRRPGNPVGPLLALLGFCPMLMAVSDMAVGSLPPLVEAIRTGIWMLWYVPPALLLLYFPDGLLPGPRWRWVSRGLIAVPAVFVVGAVFDPAAWPSGPPEVPWPIGPVALGVALAMLPLLLGLLVASAVSMVVRYRRTTDPVGRARIKWLALGAGLLPGTLLLCWFSYLLRGDSDLVMVGLTVTGVGIPAAATVAMLRHDLYDVDRALSATITYGLITTGLLAVYTVVAFAGGRLLGSDSATTAAAATAVCAVLLAPLRRRIQAPVDRRLYPVRRAALAAVDRLRVDARDGRARPEQLAEVLRGALRDPALRVGYRLPGADELVGADGGPLGAVPAADTVPVRLRGEEIGALVRGTTGSRELMRELADAIAFPVEVVRLRIDLARALRDVESSRARLLQAAYAERRRLERDLHDGAQQRLVSLGLAFRLAQRRPAPGELDGLLDHAVAELGTAVAELRRIANGLRPSSLDDGLAAALRGLVDTVPVPVTVSVEVAGVPEDVAITAYYVVSEAVANAVKHAAAGHIDVRVHDGGARLRVEVADDGRGGAVQAPGSGLSGLADRVAAAGGTLRLVSPAGRGTRIAAELPCAS
ncbi:hypothetical protein GCM10010112_54770 [Actinoplanes lobatus]|uniref:histidine kinase n=1 Tax=Actinoplanes lobatus TaxID=113568 RepID=A0A7W7HEZ2_9ACTN|nr:ATP-binding protein [Actinoplanes lobatus]MBB4749305.1 signal transduction histidine kinase [Actinoplanes lobatus]GGN79783.1 hypothetical protein GCM10010112_54770 [Actinoplanes lobatus]GIE40244.1 hypothetical protein Alo02nite_31420 [Actinoplanes lobatus]